VGMPSFVPEQRNFKGNAFKVCSLKVTVAMSLHIEKFLLYLICCQEWKRMRPAFKLELRKLTCLPHRDSER
jgi:hypothetical protein